MRVRLREEMAKFDVDFGKISELNLVELCEVQYETFFVVSLRRQRVPFIVGRKGEAIQKLFAPGSQFYP